MRLRGSSGRRELTLSGRSRPRPWTPQLGGFRKFDPGPEIVWIAQRAGSPRRCGERVKSTFADVPSFDLDVSLAPEADAYIKRSRVRIGLSPSLIEIGRPTAEIVLAEYQTRA